MSDNKSLLDKIDEKISCMSKGQKKLSKYIALNYDKAVFLTAAKLGKTVGVSESTVVRFATMLGYDGYPQFQRALESLVREKLDSIEKIEVPTGKTTKSEIIKTVMKSDMEKIRLSLDLLDYLSFSQAIDSILDAETIYVVGVRACAPLASFFAFNLRMMFKNVVEITTNNSSETFEQMLRLTENDVVIGISFPRYSMRTLKLMEYANNKNAKVVCITDSKHSPMVLYSSCNLFARTDMITVVDSLVAPLSLINALIVALCIIKKEEVIDTLTQLDKVWADYQVYGGDEINYVDEDVRIKFSMTELIEEDIENGLASDIVDDISKIMERKPEGDINE